MNHGGKPHSAGNVPVQKSLPKPASGQANPRRRPGRPKKQKEELEDILLPFVQGVAPHQQGRPYKLAGCLTLWTVAMRGRWPSKRGAIYELFHYYLPTAKRHDAQHQ